MSFLNLYAPLRRSRLDGLNDLFVLHIAISDASSLDLYTRDYPAFADRMLRRAAQGWIGARRLNDQLQGSPRAAWPVKLWLHGSPDRVWQITGDALSPVEGHPPVQEEIMDIVPRVPPPPPTDLRLDSVSDGGVALSWLPAAGADRYLLEVSSDGNEFSPTGSSRGDGARPDPDGRCRMFYVPRLGATAAYYRLWSSKGPPGNFSREPTNTVMVEFGSGKNSLRPSQQCRGRKDEKRKDGTGSGRQRGMSQS